jgi:hypothetical protein
MSRKDTAQELDRPHYYSQFWIDIAQGKRDLAAAASDGAEVEDIDDESFGIEPEPKATPKAKASKAPEKKPEPARPVISSLADLANIDLLMKSSAEMDGDEVPDIEAGAMDDLEPFSQTTTPEPAIVTDFDPNEVEDQAEASFDDSLDEDEDELDYDEEEEDDWGSSRKPSKPQKQQRRQPRERRGF